VLWIFVILTPILIARAAYIFFRKGNLLGRYYRLGSVLRYVTPVDAELKYKVERRSNAYCYFYVCQLAPGSIWPSALRERIQVDLPMEADEKAVGQNFLKKLYEGFDPNENQPLWAKVYFDPDQSGSAVICSANSVFVSAKENYVRP
jgi:hypothetical protein